jgi:Bifunctional DNA primase/polymerase, N-terminal
VVGVNGTLAAALDLHAAGFCPIRVSTDGSKKPLGTWKHYQARRPTEDQVCAWFAAGYPGIGIVTGAASGNAEMLEFEGRAIREGVFAAWGALMDASGLGDIKAKLVGYADWTPKGGIHFHYRLHGQPVPGNTKLARRPSNAEELAASPDDKVQTLIETRGEGGFVVTAPSNGTTHDTGRPWRRASGGPRTTPTLTVDEHDALMTACRALDQMPEPAAEPNPFAKPARGGSGGDRPGDDYNRRARWEDILTGWTKVYTAGTTSHWRRPGKSVGTSATTGRNDADNLYVFSSSTEFDPEKPYSKFAAYTLLQHRGDWSAAARQLAADGYGEQRQRSNASGAPDPDGVGGLPDEFWSKRKWLEHVRAAAWSRGCSAEAVLGAVLPRIAAQSSHFIKLPAPVGSRVGLTLLAALVGPPGSTKSSSEAVAVDLLPAEKNTPLSPEGDEVQVGSGEGLLDVLFGMVEETGPDGKPQKVKRQVRYNLFAYIDEGETLARQAKRNGQSTTLPTFRTSFTDGPLGQANATEERKRRIPRGQYVFGIVLGIQPAKAEDLFTDAGAGTPQRFVWMPADAEVPPPGQRPDWPGTLTRPKPAQVNLEVVDSVADEIQWNHHHRRSGCDPLDEHADLIRFKLAGVLAVMDGSHTIAEEHWALAGVIMGCSNATRARLLAEVDQQRKAANKARGVTMGEREVVANEVVDEAVRRRVAKRIIKRLETADGWISASKLRKNTLAGEERKYLDPVMASLVEAALVEERPTENNQGVEYRLGGAR